MKMKINCNYPTIIRNPEFNKKLTLGFTHIYNQDKLLTILTNREIRLALSDLYISIKELQINQGYALINTTNNPHHLPNTIKDIYLYTKENGITKKIYSENYYKYIKPYRSDYKRLYSISYEEVDNYTMLNPNTGEYAQVFTIVDCCHCVLCQKKKRNRLSSRVILESTNHINPPLFVTLTYAPEHYTIDTSDVKQHTIEIQKFNKRLRKALEQYNVKYKYFFVSEFGSQRQRLHYHAILFGLNTPELMQLVSNDFMQYDNKHLPQVHLITKLIYKAWNRGIVDVEEAQDVSGKYISKYVGKSQSGKLTKNLKSIKLGNHFLTTDKIQEIRNNTISNSFFVLINDKLEEIPLYSWISSQVYPSLCRQLDINYRKSLLSIHQDVNYYQFKDNADDNYFKQNIVLPFYQEYGKFIELLELSDLKENVLSTAKNIHTFKRILENINTLKQYKYDVEQITEINQKRNEHIMLSNVTSYDVDYNSYIEEISIANRRSSERDCQ